MKYPSLSQLLWFVSLPFLFSPIESNANDLTDKNLPLFKKQVEASIKQFEDTDRERWSFKVVRYENEEGDVTSSTEIYKPNPDKSKQWSLIELNGKKPTPKQIKRFVKKKVKASEKKSDESTNYSVRLREIIDIDSLTVTQESDTHKIMSFNVFLERLGDDAKGKLDGSLTFNKNQQFIDSITITNNSEFSPMLTASITDFSLSFKFIKMDSAILPVENTMDMKGSFAFFTDIEETSVDRFSEFLYMGPED
ncbi:MAG: hypothetical protein OQJ89_10055 [Kangiellaceae bacterium]|nr:hypothetical protein [Kangiellaceae bacterium]MCW9017297.1 hypothetical protein [Kangiellaceae bacterium]